MCVKGFCNCVYIAVHAIYFVTYKLEKVLWFKVLFVMRYVHGYILSRSRVFFLKLTLRWKYLIVNI